MLALLFQDGGGRDDRRPGHPRPPGPRRRREHGAQHEPLQAHARRDPRPLGAQVRRRGASACRPRARRSSAIERDLSVAPIPAAQMRNANNDVLRARVRRARLARAVRSKHNRVGCAAERLLRARVRLRREAERAEGRWSRRRSRRARASTPTSRRRGSSTTGGASTGVQAVVARRRRRACGREVDVRARVVVLARERGRAARRSRGASGLPDPYAQLGRGLRMHPGARRRGRLRPRDRRLARHPAELRVHRAPLARGGERQARLDRPGLRAPDRRRGDAPGLRRARTWRRCAPTRTSRSSRRWCTTRRAARSSVGRDGRPVIRYAMSERDRGQLAKGLVACARLLLAAGAREVTIPAIPPLRVASAARARRARPVASLRPHSVPLTAVHPMGTMRMGDDPRTSVVASTGRAPPAARPLRRRRLALPDEPRRAAANQHLRVRAAPRAARRRARPRRLSRRRGLRPCGSSIAEEGAWPCPPSSSTSTSTRSTRSSTAR